MTELLNAGCNRNSNVLPAGVRLDEWPEAPAQPVESTTIAALQGELRKSMPEAADLLDMMRDMQEIQQLAARLAGPAQLQIVTITTTTDLGPVA